MEKCFALKDALPIRRNRLGTGKDLTNLKFGYLTVIKKANNRKNGKIAWECLCKCGNTVEIIGNNLMNDRTKSCGCFRNELAKKAMGKIKELEKTREHGWHWKDGSHMNQGYKLLWMPDYPRADSRGYVREHIFVWETLHHKKLPKGFCIHHLNGIRNDNRPQNLIAMKIGEHIHQIDPYTRRIRELELETERLKQINLFIKEN